MTQYIQGIINKIINNFLRRNLARQKAVVWYTFVPQYPWGIDSRTHHRYKNLWMGSIHGYEGLTLNKVLKEKKKSWIFCICKSGPFYMWLSGKESTFQCRRHSTCRFYPWVMKISWRRKWLPTLVYLSWKIPWTEAPSRPQSIGSQKVRYNWVTEHARNLIMVIISQYIWIITWHI